MWDSSLLNFVPIYVNDQAIHGQVLLVNNMRIFVSFVYGMCDRNARLTLWDDLIHCADRFRNEPWVVLGDFNVTRHGGEHSASRRVTKAMKDFNSVNTKYELEDMRGVGFHFNWSNMRVGSEAVSKKIDRALGNWWWFKTVGDSYAMYHTPGISDHSPVSIQMRDRQPYRGRPFKFLNYWDENDRFLSIVKQEWDKDYSGSPVVVIHKKLKCLKGQLRELCTRPDSKVKELRKILHSVQNDLRCGVSYPNVVEKERQLRKEIGQEARMEEAFFKQKSRIQWLKEGDSNTAYFHRMVKVRQSKNHIVRIRDETGNWVEREDDIAQVATLARS
ncbi:Exo_endo_phos domain-containing protein [Cephalotus follicularis]|uniref:Exo_endo_phos domain-containing protein n=1 Tax=Cephalotus follicularis TaxID=3775 RepID=A0A1Q3CBZ5_CEPFO|nr:Exo_endo_phos domain-containing protein [Cephalotus follicularis]